MWDALIDLAQHALTTDDSLDVPADVVRRWACDADLIPVVLGEAGAVLDVGRHHRLVPPPSDRPWSSATDTAPSPPAPAPR